MKNKRWIALTISLVLVLAFGTWLSATDPAWATDRPVVVNSQCKILVHRANTPDHVEETVEAVRAAGRGNFGPELDLRMTKGTLKDSPRDAPELVFAHDDTFKRLTNFHTTTGAEDMYLTEIRGMTLYKNGVATSESVATIDQIFQVLRQTGMKSVIEIKRYPQHKAAWDSEYGLQRVYEKIMQYGLIGQVYITFPNAVAFHHRFPSVKTLWRVGATERYSAALAAKRGYDYVQFSQPYSAGRIKALKKLHIIPGTRTVHSKAQWRDAYNKGIRVFQSNDTPGILRWCAQVR